jgi:hypothetical protein
MAYVLYEYMFKTIIIPALELSFMFVILLLCCIILLHIHPLLGKGYYTTIQRSLIFNRCNNISYDNERTEEVFLRVAYREIIIGKVYDFESLHFASVYFRKRPPS